MAGTLGTDFQNGAGHRGGFTPIRLASLRIDTVTGFDLFMRPGPDQPYVLYADQTTPFTEQARQRLVDTHVQELFIDSSQEAQYRQYLETNLPHILADSGIETQEKASVLYSAAQSLMNEVFEHPQAADSMKRSRGLVQTTVSFIFSDSRAFEHLVRTASYDYYMYTHSVNTCVYGVALAQRLGHNDAKLLREFGDGLLHHDIGKTKIPAHILNKSSELTLTEWESVQKHPRVGADMLTKTGGFSPLALEVVRHHHERMSGSGYPDGLSDGEINPFARIAAVVDVFDALTTNRPFKRALSTFDALRVMSSEMAADFDPEIVRAFIQLMGNP